MDLNVHPVIPITLNKDWNLVTRTIVPIINQRSPTPEIDLFSPFHTLYNSYAVIELFL